MEELVQYTRVLGPKAVTNGVFESSLIDRVERTSVEAVGNEIISSIEDFNQFKSSNEERALSDDLQYKLIVTAAVIDVHGVFDAALKSLLCRAALPEGNWTWNITELSKTTQRYNHEQFFLSVCPALLRILLKIDADDEVVTSILPFAYPDYPWFQNMTCTMSSHIIDKADIDNKALAMELVRDAKAVFDVKNANRPNKTNRYTLNFNEEDPLWRRKPYVISYIEHALRTLDQPSIKKLWPILVPSILNIIDDYDPLMRAKGCKLSGLFFEIGDTNHLRLTGVDNLFVDAIKPCFAYLPPSTEANVSEQLVGAALDALTTLSRILGTDKKYALLDMILRDGIFQGLMYSGKYVDLTVRFLQCTDRIVNELGSRSIKHLKPLVMIFVNVMCDPFVGVYQPLIRQACEICLEIFKYCWVRIESYKFDILRGICTAWKRVSEEKLVEADTVDALRRVITALRDILKEDVQPDFENLLENDKTLIKIFN